MVFLCTHYCLLPIAYCLPYLTPITLTSHKLKSGT
jgi:hypothetical protein